MKRMLPIVLWLAGIAALVAVLVVGGGFQPPLSYFVIGVMVAGLLAGFFLYRRAQPPPGG